MRLSLGLGSLSMRCCCYPCGGAYDHGEERITEAGEERVTESGQVRVTE